MSNSWQKPSLSLGQRYFWLILLSLFCLRLVYIPLSNLAVFYDEAYYHFWSEHLDWGYFSKPPVVAWVIAFTTSILGSDSELAVKIGAPLLYLATSVVIYHLGKVLFDQRTGRYAALIFFTAPIVSFNSLFITTDAPLLFFWALSCYLFVKAVHSQSYGWWLAAAVIAGLGLLSKYTMSLLGVGLFLYLLINKNHRSELSKPYFWVAIAVCLVVFSPNLIWNWQHEFISFKHTAEISQLNRSLFHFDHLLDFVGSQFLVFGPISFFLFLSQLKAIKNNDKLLFLICVSLPILIVICTQALLSRANANWAAPAYVGLSIFVAYFLASKHKSIVFKVLIVSNLALGAGFYFYTPIQHALGIEPARKNTPFFRVSGWAELINQINEHYPGDNSRYWLSDSRKLLSYLHFYSQSPDQSMTDHFRSFNPKRQIKSEYDLNYDVDSAASDIDYLYVAEHKMDLSPYFNQVTYLGSLIQPVYKDFSHQIYIYKVSGFKGYPND